MIDLKKFDHLGVKQMKNEIILNEISKLMEVDRHDLNADHLLESYGNWDSLTAVSTIALIDQEFGVVIRGCEIEKCKTLNEIFQLAEEKQKLLLS